MIDWRSKLTSRKFWAAISAFVTGLIIAFGGTQETATQVAALIMSGAAVVAYIIGEGMADAASAGNDAPLIIHADGVKDAVKDATEADKMEILKKFVDLAEDDGK